MLGQAIFSPQFSFPFQYCRVWIAPLITECMGSGATRTSKLVLAAIRLSMPVMQMPPPVRQMPHSKTSQEMFPGSFLSPVSARVSEG